MSLQESAPWTPDRHYVLVLRATLVLLLLYGATSSVTRPIVTVLCGVLLVEFAPRAARPLWWLAVVALVLGNSLEWYSIDNHKFLIMYWAASCALSLRTEVTVAVRDLATAARLMVGLAFAFAVFWKLINGGYLDGSFFRLSFLLDPRLQPVAASLTNVPLDVLTAFSDATEYAGRYGLATHPLTVPQDQGLARLAVTLSWIGLLLEAAVAITHLIPSSRLYRPRHALLMTFVAGTYFVLPVFGFAMILTIMGLASCEVADRTMRRRYLVLFVVIHATLWPWREMARQFLQ